MKSLSRTTPLIPKGLTLLELLGTMVLLSLVTGLGAGALLGAQTHSDLTSLAAHVRHLDRMARINARMGRRVTLGADHDARELRVIDVADGTIIHQASLPTDVDLEFVTASGHPQDVRYERTGRSESYRVRISRAGDAAFVLNVFGDTGLIRESPERDR